MHRGVTFFHRLSVKRGRQYMYSTTISPLKTHISKKKKKKKKQSRQIQTRDAEGLFDHIRTCIYSPLKITFSVDTSQYKVAIGPLNIIKSYKHKKDTKLNIKDLIDGNFINKKSYKWFLNSWRFNETYCNKKNRIFQTECRDKDFWILHLITICMHPGNANTWIVYWWTNLAFSLAVQLYSQ